MDQHENTSNRKQRVHRDAAIEPVTKAFPSALIDESDIKFGQGYENFSGYTWDVVFHLGAISTIISSFERANEMMDVNAFNLIPFARNNTIKKIIFAGSESIYGEMPELCQKTRRGGRTLLPIRRDEVRG